MKILFITLSVLYLSISRIEDFAYFVSEHCLENISVGLWTRICGRLMLETKPKRNPRRIGIEFVYDSSKPLEGIIAHLTRECFGNVHDEGIVNVTASSVYNIHNQPKNAVDLGTNSYYHSNNEEDSWICYDFRDRRVIPTSCSVRSCGDGPGGPHLKSWVIEGSNHGSPWMEIDRRDNNSDLNGFRVTRNFEISKVPSESFRFFRLRQTGKNHCSWESSNAITISSLEIFGTLCRA